jgi:hypothetical protein
MAMGGVLRQPAFLVLGLRWPLIVRAILSRSG